MYIVSILERQRMEYVVCGVFVFLDKNIFSFGLSIVTTSLTLMLMHEIPKLYLDRKLRTPLTRAKCVKEYLARMYAGLSSNAR